MSFATGHLNDPNKTGSGEVYGENNTILSYPDYEDNLVPGRFAKIDTGVLSNMDGGADPNMAGVVLRRVANTIESGDSFDADLLGDGQEYVREGCVTVDALTGETPTIFDKITVSNAGDTHDGKASVEPADADHIAFNAEYIETTDTDVWLVRLISEVTPPEVVTILASGAIPLTADVLLIDTVSTVAQALTLADGYAGQKLTVKMTVDAADAVITPANFLDGTTITCDDAGDSAELMFDGTNWGVIGTSTATVA